MASPSHSDRHASDLQKTVSDAWQKSDIAETYLNAENATRPYTKIVVEKSGIAQSNADAYVFDLATGTGAAVKELYDAVPKEKWGQLKVLGGDVSSPMLEYLKKRGECEGWTGFDTQIVDGNNFTLPPNTYTHIFVSFAIFVMPDVLPKLHALLKPGGFIGVTTWASLPWQPLLARSIEQMEEKPYKPASAELVEKMSGGRPWGEKEYLAGQMREAGFERVDTVREKHMAHCGTPKVYMDVMQLPLKLVTMYWKEDKREKWLEELNGIMLHEVIKEAGGEAEQVKMEFDGNVGWGWKSD
ncbi:Nn.00g009930.m01.CDS01 [Neocucurbitaria sp. VM-36]